MKICIIYASLKKFTINSDQSQKEKEFLKNLELFLKIRSNIKKILNFVRFPFKKVTLSRKS